MPKKPPKRTTPKQRDPSWQLRHALGHKVEGNPKLTLVSSNIPKKTTLNCRTSNPMHGASDFSCEKNCEKTVKGRNRQCLSMVDCDS